MYRIVNLPTKLKVSISTHYEDMKGDRKCRKWDAAVREYRVCSMAGQTRRRINLIDSKLLNYII